MMNGSRQKCEHIDHALAVADIYFTLKPFQWLYEPVQRFTVNGIPYVWNPDCICAYLTKEGKKKLAVFEVQRTPLSERQWKSKLSIYNLYFQEAYKTAAFQQWHSRSEPIIPHVVVLSNQGNVTGLDRDFKTITTITELI